MFELLSGSSRGIFEGQFDIFRDLQEFDIIVVKGKWTDPVSAGIMVRSLSAYSHTLVVKNKAGDVWEATAGGIKDQNVFKDHRKMEVTVVRPAFKITKAKQDEMRKWVVDTQASGKGYDYLALLGFITSVKAMESENRWFCSELPYFMFWNAGFRITNRELVFPYPSLFVDNPLFDIMCDTKIK